MADPLETYNRDDFDPDDPIDVLRKQTVNSIYDYEIDVVCRNEVITNNHNVQS